jgi:hypothetical protein
VLSALDAQADLAEPTLERDATAMARAGTAALVLLVIGTVLMVAQP